MRKRVVCLLLLVCLCLAFPTLAQANVRSIPVASQGFVLSVAPDGQTALLLEDTNLAMGETPADGVFVRLLNLSDGTFTPLEGMTDFARSAAFTPDSSQVATFHGNGDVFIWNVTDGSLVKSFQTLLLGGGLSQYFPDGKTLALHFGGTPGRIALLDTNTGAITRLLGQHFDSLKEFQDTYIEFPSSMEILYTALAISPDGSTVAAATGNAGVVLWDAATGEQTELVAGNLEKPGMLSIRIMRFNADGSLVYYDDQTAALHIWNLTDQTESTVTIKGRVAALSPNGTQIAWTDAETADIYLADVTAPEDAALLVDVPEDFRAFAFLTQLQFTPDGKTLIAGGFGSRDETQNQIYVVTLP